MVAVTDAPTVLVASADTDFDQVRRDVAIQNVGDKVAYLGGPSVTPADGYPLPPNAAISFDSVRNESLPHVVADAASTTTIAVLEVGV